MLVNSIVLLYFGINYLAMTWQSWCYLALMHEAISTLNRMLISPLYSATITPEPWKIK